MTVRDAALARLFRVPPGGHAYTVERAIPVVMRDGVRLLTDVYQPRDESAGTVLVRTPYGRRGSVAFLSAVLYATHGYTVVNQSCRGTDGSEGVLEPFRNEIADGADTVAWLRDQPWFDGRLAVCGPSYLGFTAYAVLIDPPPELVTAVIAVTGHDNWAIAHGSGAFALEQVLSLMDAFDHLDDGVPRSLVRLAGQRRRLAPGYEGLPLTAAQDTVLAGSRMPYRDWLTTTSADDPLWRPLRVSDALDRVDVPILLQAGWQDRFPEEAIEQYGTLHRRGVDVALSIGPWTHLEFALQGAGPVATEALAWLDRHLARHPSGDPASPVRIFVTGAEEWRAMPDWPPAATERTWHLQPGGGLAEQLPPANGEPSRFRYDPADPTPTVGGRMIRTSGAGRVDNRRLEQRADVLTFTTPALVEPLEVIGSPVVEMAHRTDNPSADLFVRLCEVGPNGRSINLADGFQRLDPGAGDVVDIRLESLAHRFAVGSRLRLQVSGGAHPRYARNLGTAEDPATGTTLVPSRRTICHGIGGGSRLRLPIPT